ncbi:MAG TPA: hypothetical protein EYP90_07525, partial [Chromatiaceae bacterium]|nr:hypothetical protein [Chromatiaceae bacterium]
MILDLTFFLFAVPAVIFAGVSKGGFGSGVAFAATPLLALIVSPGQAIGLMLPLLMLMDVTALRPYWRKWDWPGARALMTGAVPGVALGALLYSVADADLFRRTARRFAQALLDHPTTGKSLPVYGTSVLVSIINELGGLPTHNFRRGSFERADQISGEALHDLIVARNGKTTHPCMAGCVIRCSNVFPDENGKEQTRGFEYESIVLLGANCGIGDLDVIARLNHLCDEYGLDTMEIGDSLAVVMEAGLAEFGDGERAIALVEEIGAGTPLGRVLGHGTAVTGRVFNVSRVPVVKGQGISAYDPRAL